MRDLETRPPAILLGADTPIGLTVIRELGEHGVPVHAIARSREGIGLYSKWTTARYIRPLDDDATIALLNRIATEHGARFLLGVSERDLRFIRSAADSARLPGLKALVPSADKLAVVGDKLATYAVAKEVGIPLAATWHPPAGHEPGEPPEDLVFPCILKWSNPEEVQRWLADRNIAWLKAEYCYDRDELRRSLARYQPLGRYPLVQAFCPGTGLGHMIFIDQGEALLRLQHRRVAEWPPEGGTSTVCESLPLSVNASLFSKSEALLRRIGWQGAAMVEYRFDRQTGKTALMEVNGRFWGSLPLAYHAGTPFAWYTYAVLGLGERPSLPRYRAGIRCRYMIPETRRVAALMRHGGRTQNRALSFSVLHESLEYLRQFFGWKSRYYVLTPSDPLPFFVDLVFAAARACRRLRQRRRQQMAHARMVGTAKAQ